jgi:hypothetical protein
VNFFSVLRALGFLLAVLRRPQAMVRVDTNMSAVCGFFVRYQRWDFYWALLRRSEGTL